MASTRRPVLGAKLERVFVLGIDPGLSRCGYGVLERDARGPRAVAGGVITTDTRECVAERLSALLVDLRALVAEVAPDAVAVERVFFQTNALTATSVAQAAGLALVAAAEGGCEVAEYTSNEVKQAVVGYGNATKAQVQRMVAQVLGLSVPPRPPDVADALGLALCHLASEPLRRSLALSAKTAGQRAHSDRSGTPSRRDLSSRRDLLSRREAQ